MNKIDFRLKETQFSLACTKFPRRKLECTNRFSWLHHYDSSQFDWPIQNDCQYISQFDWPIQIDCQYISQIDWTTQNDLVSKVLPKYLCDVFEKKMVSRQTKSNFRSYYLSSARISKKFFKVQTVRLYRWNERCQVQTDSPAEPAFHWTAHSSRKHFNPDANTWNAKQFKWICAQPKW